MTDICCRFCASTAGAIVLDLGEQPACDHFPAVTDPGPDPRYPLRMWLCGGCGLAQLAEDPTTPDEPRGREPEALVAQAREAVSHIAAAGLLPEGATVLEYGSPHGGSWLGLIAEHRADVAAQGAPADVVVDCFGLMHAADQRAALAERAARLQPGGTLLLQFHSLATILRGGQWNALRHGHFAYYSTPVLVDMLETVGLTARTARVFPLYGGTVLLAASKGGAPDADLQALVTAETNAGVRLAGAVGGLQGAAATAAAELADEVRGRHAKGQRVLGYSAASRAVSLLLHAGLDATVLPAIADASPAKHGRRMPGTDIPVVDPDELLGAEPDAVVLFVPDLLPEVRSALPQIESRGGSWLLAERGGGL